MGREHSTALLVCIFPPALPVEEREERIEEMIRLADTAGLKIRGRIVQVRESPDPSLCVGRGKVEEISRALSALGGGVVVFNTELSPVQMRNIESSTGARVVDRTQMILDIFAARARSAEGKLQVELARLLYELPRLVGRGREMSRLGGGIGTRGPGETRLETDRRRMRSRISRLRAEIDAIAGRRDIQRSRRRSAPWPLVALVGYTNAGKSTLLNLLAGAHVFAEDRLFATLDPTVRRVRLPSGQWVLLVDTVGFIRDLPHELVAAFRATLEEVVEADVLVHVVDASSRSFQQQMEVVSDILRSLGVAETPVVTAFNKCDVARVPDTLLNEYSPSVRVSGVTGEGAEALLRHIDGCLSETVEKAEFVIPYEQQSLISLMHSTGKVTGIEYAERGVRVSALLPRAWSRRIRNRIGENATGGAGG